MTGKPIIFSAPIGEVEARSIRRLLSTGWALREIAERFGVPVHVIADIKNGKQPPENTDEAPK